MREIGEEEFANLMSGFGPFLPDLPQYPIGVAVSGGADSLCLAFLLRRWRQAVLALVVDHGLREGSAQEAQITADRLRALDIPSIILTIGPIDASSRLQEQARHARYEIMARACLERGVLDLALGHHERDQIETFYLRQTRKSTAHGLAAMASARETPNLRYLRPLLSVRPERLRATLVAQGVSWVEDPSNQNRRFERVRIRQCLDQVQLETGRREVAAYGLRRNGLNHAMPACLNGIRVDPLGFAVMGALPDDPVLLGRLWKMISGSEYPPAPDAIRNLIAAPRSATLGGGMLCPAGKLGSGWVLLREPEAISDRKVPYDGLLWDRRFRLSGKIPSSPCAVAPLGDEARRYRHHRLSARVLATLPAIWQGDRVVAVPSLNEPVDAPWADLAFEFEPECTVCDASFWSEYRETVKT